LSDLTFAEKQLIAVASSHTSLLHLKNGTLGSRGHCVAVEQDILKLFLILPRDPTYLNILNIRRSGRSSDQEVYQNIFKVWKQKVLAALYFLFVGHNVLYQYYKVIIDPSNLDWIGDDDECTLPITCTIDTQDNDTPEDDDVGPSPDQTIMDQLDK
jgi:hypothetical protein